MRTPREFERAVLARPDSDAPRLVYADWLDDRGDPRGEFVRLQCALAALPANDPRRERLHAAEAALLDAHAAAWAKPVSGLVDHLEFRRGFVESVRLSADAFLANAATLFRLAPVRRVALTDAGRTLDAWLDRPELRLVRALDLVGNSLGDAGARALAACPRLQRLTDLGLSFNELTDASLIALGHRGALRSLTRLDLSLNGRLTAEGLGLFATLPLAGQLDRLDLAGCRFGPSAMRALLSPRAFPRLRSLAVAGNPLRDAGLRLLLRAPFVPRWLEHDAALDLSACRLTAAGVQSLIECPAAAHVRTLNLNDNPLGDEGLTALSVCQRFPHLTALHLRDTDTGDEGVIALAASPLLRQLTTLDLSRNRVHAAGHGAYMFSPMRPWRLVPDFDGNPFQEALDVEPRLSDFGAAYDLGEGDEP